MNMKKVLAFLIIFSMMFVSSSSPIYQVADAVEMVENEKIFEKIVTLTTYSANIAETDSTPNLTASGFVIDLDNPKKHRILAISRDLKRELKWGEKVVLENAGRFNGIWYVRDLMNPRFRNKIDVLINEGDKPTKLYNVILKRLE